MAKNVEVSVGDALTKIVFRDNDGDIIAWFKINLMDARLPGKLGEFAAFLRIQSFEGSVVEQMEQLDNALIEKFNYLLGYDCRGTLFGRLSPTTVFSDGDMFITKILHRISDSYTEEVKAIAAQRAAAVEKFTAKYN